MFGVCKYSFLTWLFFSMNGVIGNVWGIGKNFKVCRYAFLFIWKLQINWVCQKYLLYTFYWSKVHVNIITGSRVMTIFIYNGLIGNLEIPLSEFSPISKDWRKLGILNLARIFLMKCYWTLEKHRVTAFTICELSRKNQ